MSDVSGIRSGYREWMLEKSLVVVFEDVYRSWLSRARRTGAA
jgi:hypothetical protein